MAINRILIIDDDDAIVETLKILLVVKGFEIETAFDGDEGLKKAGEFQPDLILLDLLLPLHDGYEVYRGIKANPDCCDTHVLFLSSFSRKPDSLIDSDEKMDVPEEMFVPKPIDPIGLLEKIDRLSPKSADK